MLPDYVGIGKDVRVLPSYVTSLVLTQRFPNMAWTTPDHGKGAPRPRSEEQLRKPLGGGCLH